MPNWQRSFKKTIESSTSWNLRKNYTAFREDMRNISEEQEEANEQLQSANEELLSANEELQSLNEELETSKEEYQSTNEELSSLNEEYNSSRIYAESIVETIREPVIVLDKDLRIRTANKAFCQTFNVQKEASEGILIYELANREWDIPALRSLLEDIMPKEKSFTGFEVKQNFAGIGERVMLLNALEMKQGKDKENLILLAIEDITEQALRFLKKKELLTRFQNLVMQAPVAICILNGENHILELANTSYLELIGKDHRADISLSLKPSRSWDHRVFSRYSIRFGKRVFHIRVLNRNYCFKEKELSSAAISILFISPYVKRISR